jgi:hypothetical protein
VSLRGEPAPHRFASIIARAAGDRASIVSLLREEVRNVDPDLPGYDIQTMDEVLARSRSLQSVLSAMFALLAGIAVLLASVGLYAVTAHGVTQRTQEIGIRVALGAQSSQVIGLFLKRTVVQLVIGLVVGLAGAIVVGRLLEQFLVRTAPTDHAYSWYGQNCHAHRARPSCQSGIRRLIHQAEYVRRNACAEQSPAEPYPSRRCQWRRPGAVSDSWGRTCRQ